MSVETTIRTPRHVFTVRESGCGNYECVLRSVNNGDSIPHEMEIVKGSKRALQMTQAFVSFTLDDEDLFCSAAIRALYTRAILRS